jgi:hypothetical protein
MATTTGHHDARHFASPAQMLTCASLSVSGTTKAVTDIPLLCPVEPHEMDKAMRRGFNEIVRRVTVSATAHGWGNDLLLRIYTAGIFHGVELQKRTPRESLAPEGQSSRGRRTSDICGHDKAVENRDGGMSSDINTRTVSPSPEQLSEARAALKDNVG